MIKNEDVVRELRQVAAENDGVLRAEDVVRRAGNPDSAMHSWFQWDDTEAAHNWRLHQARQLIRVTVSYVQGDKDPVPMRVFVSLSSDRTEDGGGYRLTTSVLSDQVRRQQLIADALQELNRAKAKYKDIRELDGIWDAVRKVEQQRELNLEGDPIELAT